MKMIKKVLFWVVLVFPFWTNAQQVNSTTLYTKALEINERNGNADSIALLLNKAIKDESAKVKPDVNLLGNCYLLRGGAHQFKNNFTAAYTDYCVALQFLAKAKSAYTSNAIEGINKSYLGIIENDLSLINASASEFKEEKCFFSITEILKVKEDTIWAKVNAGLNDGLYTASVGGVLSAYSKEYPDRGNDELGNCRVTSVSNTYSIVEIVTFERAKKENLYAISGDNVMLKIKIPINTYDGNLHRMALLNIRLLSSTKAQVINPNFLFNYNNQYTEKAINQYYLADEIGTAEWLYDSTTMKNSPEYPPLTKGAHKGYNMWEAMQNSNEEDIKAFQRFVLTYPAKYMGRNFKSNETYATWVTNNTPPSNSETAYAYNQIIETPNDSLLLNALAQQISYYLLFTDSTILADEHAKHSLTTSHLEAIAFDWSTQLAQVTERKQLDSALVIANKLIMVANYFKNDSFLMPLFFQKAYILSELNQKETAIEIYTQCIQLNIRPFEGYWYRAGVLYAQERYKEALADYEKVSELADWFAAAYGMRGWVLLKTGKFKQAFDYCLAAHEKDPYNESWAVNLGHAFLMQEELEKAQKMYDEALSLITVSSNFYTGLIADFDTFISNGWNAKTIESEKKRLTQLWNANYKFRLLADSFFQSGKEKIANAKYGTALSDFKSALISEDKNTIPDESWKRAYNRWIAYTYFKNNDLALATQYYKNAFDIAQKLDNVESQISDLEDLANISGRMNKQDLKGVYTQMAAALQRKNFEKARSNKMFIVTIGAPKGADFSYKYCEKDAAKIGKLVKDKSVFIYDTVYNYQVVGNSFTLTKVNNTLKEILELSRPGDALFFYIAANTFSEGNKRGFLVGKDSLWIQDLQYWSTNVACQKQLFVWDIYNVGQTDEFLSIKNEGSLNGKFNQADLILIANKGARIEGSDSSGILSQAIFEALSGRANTGFSANDRSISAKELEAFVFDKLGSSNLYMQVTTFSEGLDFPIVSAPLPVGTKDINGPKLVLSTSYTSSLRGLDVDDLEDALYLNGQAIDEGGVAEVTVNNKKVALAINGRFSYAITEANGAKLIIKATDKEGNQSVDSIEIESNTNKQKSEALTETVNRALLFGIDIYDEWGNLKNPLHDVSEIKKVLTDYYGYEVTLVPNATQNQIRTTIDSFLRLTYGPNDNLIVFFAGHGVLDPIYGGHIVCKDSKKEDRTFSTYYSFNHLANSLDRQQNCKHVFLVLDVCFGGGIFAQQTAPAYYGNDVYSEQKDAIRLQKILKSKSRMYLTSGGETYVSDGRPGYHSPFATRFIQALEAPLKNQKAFITLKDVVDYVRDLPEGQEPRYGSFGTDFDRNADLVLKPIKYYGGITKAVEKTPN